MIQKLKKIIDLIAYPVYLLAGRKPWSPGYYTAKRRLISKAIDSQMFVGTNELPTGYGSHMDERVIEYPWVYSRLKETPGSVLDAGSALNHDFLVDRKPLSNGKLTICTLAPEKRCYFSKGISYIYDDLRASVFREACFDTVISISTIEHIGLDNTMLYTSDGTKNEDNDEGYRAAVREFRRIIRPGGSCLITVPYGKASVRGWFQVFDAVMVEKVVKEFSPAHVELNYFAYQRDGWRQARPEELADATFFDVHQDSKYDDDRAGGARGVVCMHLVA